MGSEAIRTQDLVINYVDGKQGGSFYDLMKLWDLKRFELGTL